MYRRLAYSVCFTLTLGLSVSAEGGTMIAHWRLDNDATDSVGGIDGTLVNGPEFTTDAMVGSHALALDSAASQYVDFGNPQKLPAGRSPRSIAGWGKTSTVAAGWRWIAAYGSAGTSLAMFIGMNGTSLYGGGYGDDVLEAGFWEVDVWHHICLTYDGSVAKLYADGVEVDSQTKSWNLALGRAHIGQQVNDAAEFWDGVVDDVRIYDYALSVAEITKLAAIAKATRPNPPDGGIHPDTWVTLSWTPGGYAVSHDVYLGENSDDVNDGTGVTFRGNQTATYFVAGFPGFAYPGGLVPGTTYYWRIDEVNDADPRSPWRGDLWSFTVPPRKAYEPNPADGARFVDLNPTLSWTPGFGAKLHTVYFDNTFDAVNDATQGARAGTTTYVPGTLELDATYYWRVDEFDGSLTHKGDVWKFKTMPNIPIQDPNLVGWWKLDEGQGTRAVDWSGYRHHGTLIGGPQWTSGYDGGALQLDGGDDYVNFSSTSGWPTGTSARSMCGWGKTSTVAGGYRWIAAYGTPSTSQAMFIGMLGNDLVGGGYGGDDVTASDFWQVDIWRHICLTYDGTRARLYADGIEVASEAKTWNLALGRGHIGRQVNDAAEFWDGLVDDVRIYNRVLTPQEIQQTMRGDTLLAWQPSPADGSTPDIDTAIPLSWSPGDKASGHDVYFGTDEDAVTNANASDTTGIYRGRQTATMFAPAEGVQWGSGPYYWRIDEVNNDGTMSTGRIWSFTVADYLSIDDFESYDAGDNQIWYAWHDGLGYGAPGTPPYFAGNGTGAAVGDEATASFTEETIVHGGRQSMPVAYDNNKQGFAKYSEAELTLTAPRDWTGHGVAELSLWFRGNPANTPEPLYVGISNSAGQPAVVVHPDPAAAQTTTWTEWVIPLSTLANQGITLTNVDRIAIGLGTRGNMTTPGGSGKMYFDDIRLYRPRP